MTKSSGQLVLDGNVIDMTGESTFIHAIQGMRPDSVRLYFYLYQPESLEWIKLMSSSRQGGTLASLPRAAVVPKAS